MILRMRSAGVFALLASLALVACGASSDDATSEDDSEALSGSPDAINVGFNGGADQFAYYDEFFSVSVRPGPRLCHWYLPWNVADQNASMGDANSPKRSRAYFEYWLKEAKGHCDEALISFQAEAPAAPPTEKAFGAAFAKFVGTNWAQETGFTGALSFTPWNEPNNGAGAGDGLGKAIEPELAAAYFLSAARTCKAHGCKVAAGDFASNGGMWNDFEWNCANDNVQRGQLCKEPSALNKDGRAASYLDRYKDYIAQHADDFGLGSNYRPKYFAFHGWHDINEYLDTGSHCSSYTDCATRRVLKSFGGSWGGVELWDTEVGVDQDRAPISDAEQACGAAFLLRLTALNRRVTRIYYTRIHGGTGELYDGPKGNTARAALDVLAHRETTYAAGHCK